MKISAMPKTQSYLIPTITVSLTLSALIVPFALASPLVPAPTPRESLCLSLALSALAAACAVLLGAVRRRDLLRVANARQVLHGLGRTPLPARRIFALSGWSLGVLLEDLVWGQALHGSARTVRLLSRAGAVLALIGGGALVLKALGLTPPLPIDPGPASLAPLVLWPVAELSLRRSDGAPAPTPWEIRRALEGLGERFADSDVLIGIAAMTGVEQGLELVLPMIPRRGAGAREPIEATDGEELLEEVGA